MNGFVKMKVENMQDEIKKQTKYGGGYNRSQFLPSQNRK